MPSFCFFAGFVSAGSSDVDGAYGFSFLVGVGGGRVSVSAVFFGSSDVLSMAME